MNEEEPRQSNNELFRSLQAANKDLQRDIQGLSKEVGKVCVEMASFRPQLDMVVKIAEQTQMQLSTLITRTEGTERDLITVRSRIENLETRPLAPTPEEQGELRRTITEHSAAIKHMERVIHDDANAIQALKLKPDILSVDETAEAKRMLKLINKYETDDLFTREETDALKVVVADRAAGKNSRDNRKATIQNAVISALAGGIIIQMIIPLLHNLHP